MSVAHAIAARTDGQDTGRTSTRNEYGFYIGGLVKPAPAVVDLPPFIERNISSHLSGRTRSNLKKQRKKRLAIADELREWLERHDCSHGRYEDNAKALRRAEIEIRVLEKKLGYTPTPQEDPLQDDDRISLTELGLSATSDAVRGVA